MGLFADSMSIRSLVSLSGRSCRIASVATTTTPATTTTTSTTTVTTNVTNTSINNFKGDNNATSLTTNINNSKTNDQQQENHKPKLSQSSLSSNSSTLSSDNVSIMNPINIRKLQKNNNKSINGSSCSSSCNSSSNSSSSNKNKTGILSECAISIAATTPPTTNATNKISNNHHQYHHHKGSSFVFTSTKRDAFEKNHHHHYHREGNNSSDSNSMQQLSTSWEFIKLGERPIPADVSVCSNDKGNKSKITQPQQQQQQQQQDSATAPRYITITDGKILLGPPEPDKLVTSTATATAATTPLSSSESSSPSSNMQSHDNNTKENKKVIARVAELEEALNRLQDNRISNGHCQSPILEKNLKKQLKNAIKSTVVSEEKTIVQECKEHKMLQARFTRQENLLYLMQQENKSLQQRIRQYEHCLDDVIRKVVDAIVAEDSLREEVTMLKSRVRDLEAQNAALYVKSRDEGYCTMNTVQPQLSNSHLEDLLEEPEQWLLTSSSSDNNTTDMILYNEINDCDDDDDGNNICEPTTSCSAADMEDWSMSQEELNVITLNSDLNNRELDWIWNSNIMMDSQSEDITKLLQETVIYSEDEEISCIDFTKDFYKLVSIPSGSTKSLYSHVDTETDNDAEDNGENDNNDEENETNSDNNSCQQININLKVNDEDKKNHVILSSPSEVTQKDICSTTRTLTENNNDIVQSTIQNNHRHTDTSIARSSVQSVKNKVKSLNRKLLSTVGINYEINENKNSVNNSDCGTVAAAINKQSSISADLIKHQRVHPLKVIATNPSIKPITAATTTAVKSKIMMVSPSTATQSKIQSPSVPIKW